MHGVDNKNLHIEFFKGRQAVLHLGLHIVAGKVRKVLQIDLRAAQEVFNLFHGQWFRQTAGHIVCMGIEVSCKLGNFGKCPDKGLFRIRSCSGSPDDLTHDRKRRWINTKGADSRHPGIKGKIIQVYLYAVAGEFFYQFT